MAREGGVERSIGVIGRLKEALFPSSQPQQPERWQTAPVQELLQEWQAGRRQVAAISAADRDPLNPSSANRVAQERQVALEQGLQQRLPYVFESVYSLLNNMEMWPRSGRGDWREILGENADGFVRGLDSKLKMIAPEDRPAVMAWVGRAVQDCARITGLRLPPESSGILDRLNTTYGPLASGRRQEAMPAQAVKPGIQEQTQAQRTSSEVQRVRQSPTPMLARELAEMHQQLEAIDGAPTTASSPEIQQQRARLISGMKAREGEISARTNNGLPALGEIYLGRQIMEKRLNRPLSEAEWQSLVGRWSSDLKKSWEYARKQKGNVAAVYSAALSAQGRRFQMATGKQFV